MAKKQLGVLVIHGFSGNPKGLHRIEPPLKELGLPYIFPTLKGHAEDNPDALLGIHWSEWVKDGKDALNQLLEEVSKVIVVGHSMGGWIALNLAMEHRDKIDSIVVAASTTRTVSPFGPGGIFNFLAPLIPIIINKWDMTPVFADPSLTTVGHGYEWIPSKTWLNAFGLAKETEKRLSEVNVPILILHSRNDSGNSPKGVKVLFDGISTSADQKEVIWYEKSEHDMFNDCERDVIIDDVVDFIKKRLSLLELINIYQ